MEPLKGSSNSPSKATKEDEGNLGGGTKIPPAPRAVEREATQDKYNFWSILVDCIYRHHVAPRGQLYVRCSRIIISNPSEVHRREQTDENPLEQDGRE